MTETGDNFHPSAPRPGLLKRKRRERLLLPLNSILPRRESQRDSDPKPRVARHELPWETAEILHQPQRGCAFGPNERRNPLGVGFPSFLIPRVARASQPWAWRRNPVGILQTGQRQGRGKLDILGGSISRPGDGGIRIPEGKTVGYSQISHPGAGDFRLPGGDGGLYLPEGVSIIAQQFTAGLDS